MSRARADLIWYLLWAIVALCVVGYVLSISKARADDTLIEPTAEEYASIKTWIPQTCCWTNNCCKKVHESALTAMPNNQVRVEATGQVLPRTGWSRDRNTWRCTCDDVGGGKYHVHVKAFTRCVFDQLNGS